MACQRTRKRAGRTKRTRIKSKSQVKR
jgi:hypothetical protein